MRSFSLSVCAKESENQSGEARDLKSVTYLPGVGLGMEWVFMLVYLFLQKFLCDLRFVDRFPAHRAEVRLSVLFV